MKSASLLWFIACVFYFADSSKFPSQIPKCRVSDGECVIKTTNIVLKHFYGGEPRIALPSLDPLKINRMHLKQGGNSTVHLDLIFREAELIGLRHFTCISMRGFKENPNGHYDMRFKGPKLELVGPYRMTGQILVLPILGNGVSNITLMNPELHARFTGKSRERNGKTYLYTDDLRLTIKISRMYSDYTNLFNGHALLAETTNRFLNENWKEIYHEIKESLFDACSLIIQSMVNNMMVHSEYKDLFLQ